MLEYKFVFLVSSFVTCILTANIIATKIIDLGWIFQLPAAVFVYPLTFLITDTINEVWGREKARQTVMLGFYMSLIMLFFIYLSKILPPAYFYEGQQAYETVFGMVPRIVFASMLAYLLAQLYDVWIFNLLKQRSSGKYLWLRNNLSTMTSQLLDSVVFLSIAFWGVFPPPVLLTLIISQYLVKLIMALLDTPFCYLLVKWVRSGKEMLLNER